MYIEKILVKNFRNLHDILIELNKNLNVFTGANGQGKTNFLEAIYLLGTGESHRTNSDSELINWDKSQSLVQLKLIRKEQDIKITCKLMGKNKKIEINDNPLGKVSDLLGNLNVVLFSPEDLQLVKGGPSLRRNFINIEVSQVSNYYYKILKKYNHVLKQRNNLLKNLRNNNKKNIDILNVWDEQLIDLGSKVIKKRLQALEKLKILARLKQRQLTNGKENLSVIYDSSIKGNIYNGDISLIFKKNLVNNKDKEIERGYTLFGPHRDDIIFEINNIDLRKFGSQGQQRTTALALKMAELEFMKSETGEYPVLLLDDVFSELDKNRREAMINIIEDKIQTFITTTEIKDLVDINIFARDVFKVNRGEIKRG